ncbi:hypothetical protein ATCC90586_003173 [Pythium insidiosum]|nr:hypothetical protein ATCC90586_003173 [Pythium insidiosum]
MEFYAVAPAQTASAALPLAACRDLFEGDTLLIPSVSYGNLGQLTIDLLINTLLHRGEALDAAIQRVGHLFTTTVPPLVGAPAFSAATAQGNTDAAALCVNLEVYRIPSRRLTIIQQRTDVTKGLARTFARELAQWASGSGFAEMLVVSGADDMLRHDHNMLRRPLLTIGTFDAKTVRNAAFLQADSVSWADVRGCGVAPLLHNECDALSLPFLAFILPCAEGDNVPDAVQMSIHTLRFLEIPFDDPATDKSESKSRFSLVRCAFSILSLLLVLTDIPRTGLTVDFKDWPVVAPGVYIYYGPFNYPTATYVRNESSGVVTGLRRGTPLTAAKLWAYKFDTLSIPQRAIAMHLNVTAYPPCVLYRGACQDPELLPLTTAFTMLDELVSALQKRYFAERGERRPFVFVTKSNWLDRLHHTIIQFMWRRQDDRLFTAHHLRFDPITAPGEVAKTVQVPMGTHIDLRTQALRQQFPDLNIDLTIITTRNGFSNPRSSWLPMISYWTENFEVTTLLRARRCHNASACETVLLDDYRYERTAVESDAREWDAIIMFLRGSAQTYIWLRLLSAWVCCFYTRRSERTYRERSTLAQVMAAWSTFFLLPIHCLIYSSWFPVVSYALAHVLDSGVTHIVQNSIWSSSNGILEKFEFVKYTVAASLQMRNIWLIALAWKIVLWLHMKCIAAPRGRGWTQTDGLIGFRGLFIGSISSLTVFSFLRALRFRNTNVEMIHILPRHAPLRDIQGLATMQNSAEYGYNLDGKTGLVATVIVSCAWLSLQLIVSLSTRRPTHFFFSRTYYVPLSAGALWPQSSLHVFWYLPVTFSEDRRSSFFAAIRRSSSVAMAWKELSCSIGA